VKRLIDQSFRVKASLSVAWNHLARIEDWPTWARHIRSVARTPPGPLSIRTCGTILLSNGISTTFKMIEFEPMRHWKWRASFLGARIDYDHAFAEADPGRTEVRFTIDASGWQVPFIGPIFAGIYRRNLRRAIPLLIAEIESKR
jgi:polyketide cyclase/dehydrase/lipid transport protein